MDKERKFISEVKLLKWIHKSKNGVTVVEASEHFKVTRQCAYGRLERATEKGYVSFTFETSTGPREQARYMLTELGRGIAERKWRKVSDRLMEARA